MEGMFDIDWEAVWVKHGKGDSSFECPNCGVNIYRRQQRCIDGTSDSSLVKGVEDHECADLAIEKHHVARFRQGWETEINWTGLSHWREFVEFCATPEGIFEQRYAEAHRS